MKEKKRERLKGKSRSWTAELPHLREMLLRYDYLLLFIGVYLVYNTVSRMTMSGDTNPAAFLPLALLLHQTVFFDAFVGAGLGPNVAYAFPLVNGHYVSLFPIVTPVLITPVYLLSYVLYSLLAVPFDSSAIMVLAKTAASVIAALSCVFVYLAGKELFSRKIALATALIYAFATSTWAVSSQALWQHGTVELLLIAMLYLILRNEREPSKTLLIALGLLSGLFVFNRPPDSILLIPVVGYVIWYERKHLPLYAVSAAVTGLPFLVYNLSIFGNMFGGYQENLGLFAFGIGSAGNFAGLLLSPNIGLLVFSPVLLLAVAGYLKLNTLPEGHFRQVLVLFGPVFLLQVLVYSFFGRWDSSVAYSYGQRFLTGAVPVLALYTGIVLNQVCSPDQPGPSRHGARAAIVLLVAASVIIQAIGVFFYPLYPDRSTSETRNWDWDHPIILESFWYGISHTDSITTLSFPPLPPVLHLSFGTGDTGSP